MELTLRWARRSKKYFEEHKHEVPWFQNDDHVKEGQSQSLFGIVQGGMDHPIAERIGGTDLGDRFPGYAIGGLSVGEPRELTQDVVESTMRASASG